MDIMLYENPYQPVGFDELGNPVMLGNPHGRKRRKSRRRNPRMGAARTTIKRWVSIDPMDIVAAGGGFAAATLLPNALVKTTDTTMDKALKVGAIGLTAVAAGSVASQLLGTKSEKAALYAGLGLMGATIVNFLRPGTIANRTRALPVGRPARRLGENVLVSPNMDRSAETISVIQP